MALTNFAAMTNEELTVWQRKLWRQARNQSFMNRFLGKSPNSVFQHITELKKSSKGARAVITLLADLEGDGVTGDNTLEGNEGVPRTHECVIRLDQIRNATRHEGRMADQKSVVEFRENAHNMLSYWLADRLDQLTFLTLAGWSYNLHNRGNGRTGSPLHRLEFASDIAAPTPQRVARWNGTTKRLEIGGATTDVAAADMPMWEMLVQLKAYAKESYMRPAGTGGDEAFHVFMSPGAMARLKLDETYMKNLRHAQSRDNSNPLFTGSTVKVDGLYIHEHNHVPNTLKATTKWGAAGDVDGCQILFCGAQALGVADIGQPTWEEKGFDYENQQGVAVGKIMGFLKPQFESQYLGGAREDHGVISVYAAQ